MDWSTSGQHRVVTLISVILGILGEHWVNSQSTIGAMKMRIYYFGELIKDTNNHNKKPVKLNQTKLNLEPAKAPVGRKAGMQSIGELLKDIDMNLDSFRPNRKQSLHYQ